MADLVWVMNQLTDLHGHINIDGLNELVAPITPEERKLYETIDFDQVWIDFVLAFALKTVLESVPA